MNAFALALAALGGAVLFGARPRPRPGPVALAAGRSYRVVLEAPYALSGEPESVDRQTDVRVELLPLSAYDIEFSGREVSFTMTPLGPRTVMTGVPVSSSAAGSALIVQSVTEVDAPGVGA